MVFRESESIELKRMYVDDIRKEIVSMANGSGGTIYVGIDDDGSIAGLENCDEIIQRISNTVRDSIKPDITLFLHYDILNTLIIGGKHYGRKASVPVRIIPSQP